MVRRKVGTLCILMNESFDMHVFDKRMKSTLCKYSKISHSTDKQIKSLTHLLETPNAINRGRIIIIL